MSTYPVVVGEERTLEAVLAGNSIGRYGDGEMSIARGGKCVSQVADTKLTEELREILLSKHKECLVGIPTMDMRGPKWGNWSKYEHIYAQLLNPKKVYYSAFITRPDSAPWIKTQEYFDKVESLWKGKTVTLVGNGRRSLVPAKLHSAAQVDFVECSYSNSYEHIERLYAECVLKGNKVNILCCGPTATVLAYRLSRIKIGDERMQGVDLGHIGLNGFWRKY